MAKYDDFNTAYIDLLWLLLDNGKKINARSGSLGDTRELLDMTFTVPATKPLCTLTQRKMSYAFVLLEPFFLFTHQGKTDIAGALMTYAPNLKKLALNEATGKFDGNYGDRIHLATEVKIDGGYSATLESATNSQLIRVYNLLKKDPSSRRAVITIHNPTWDIVDGESKDIPCTLNLQFLIRDGKLDCFCQMRSNDVWYGTPHNVMMFTFLQRAIAGWLGVPPGNYHHRATSFHLYEQHAEAAAQVLANKTVASTLPSEVTYPCHPGPTETYRRALDMIAWEAGARQAIPHGEKAPEALFTDPYEQLTIKKVVERLSPKL